FILSDGFYNSGLVGVEFPKVQRVESQAFLFCQKLREIYLPECNSIGRRVFEKTNLTTIFAPYIDYTEKSIFESNLTIYEDEKTEALLYRNEELTNVNFEKLKTISRDFFEYSAVKQLELSDIEFIYDLPTTISYYEKDAEAYKSFYGVYDEAIKIELVLPKTLKYCEPVENYRYSGVNDYCVYGTKWTYAEQWAHANNVEFIEITQETAIREDIEPIWDEWSYKPLEFDARGFNRTYQWYGYNKTKENAVAITGATEKTFNPENYKQYRYYYCEMTSVDGDSIVTVTSGTCHNKMYNMFALNESFIDYDKKLIYTKLNNCKNLSTIIKIQNESNCSATPSFSNGFLKLFGTGSKVVFTNEDGTFETYTLIIPGDINGDSIIDVIDLANIELTMNSQKELTGEYFLAADTNMDNEITIEDYSSAVNLAVFANKA
ncbi:MAG: leucine-rich repeat protein, partial [Clostridia bacterium]|nr:leucine-rich repeat protein [Clostridia bacterium]